MIQLDTEHTTVDTVVRDDGASLRSVYSVKFYLLFRQ